MAYESRKLKEKSHWLQLKKEALNKRALGERLTLEETAVAIWDPNKEKQPLTCMGVLKIEKRALAKIKAKLKDYGINDLSDIVEPKYREYGKIASPSHGN